MFTFTDDLFNPVELVSKNTFSDTVSREEYLAYLDHYLTTLRNEIANLPEGGVYCLNYTNLPPSTNGAMGFDRLTVEHVKGKGYGITRDGVNIATNNPDTYREYGNFFTGHLTCLVRSGVNSAEVSRSLPIRSLSIFGDSEQNEITE